MSPLVAAAPCSTTMVCPGDASYMDFFLQLLRRWPSGSDLLAMLSKFWVDAARGLLISGAGDRQHTLVSLPEVLLLHDFFEVFSGHVVLDRPVMRHTPTPEAYPLTGYPRNGDMYRTTFG